MNEAAQRCQRFVSGWHETYQDLIDRLAPKNNCKVGMTILFYEKPSIFSGFFLVEVFRRVSSVILSGPNLVNLDDSWT